MSLKVINQYMSASERPKDGTGELYIYGDIVDEKWWDEEVSPKSVRDALDALDGAKNLDIHINSYGGSCVAGNAIISILDAYRRKNSATLNVYIEGIAASMGSGIASVGDKVYMCDNAMFMLHKPLSWACGNADELRKTIEVLDKTEETLVANYMRRFNGTEDELRQIMADETWMTADEAKNCGLVDEIIKGAEIAASAKGIKIGNQEFGQSVYKLVKDKFPGVKIQKEEPVLAYDEKLKAFGITEDAFNGFKIDSAVLLDVAGVVAESVKSEPVEQFVDKASALETLGVADITADELLNYAKSGMNPVDTTELKNKAAIFDRLKDEAVSEAISNAVRANGECNEERTKKMLSNLSYDEIVAQSKEWAEQGKKVLNAGKRISRPADSEPAEKPENIEDYEVV